MERKVSIHCQSADEQGDETRIELLKNKGMDQLTWTVRFGGQLVGTTRGRPARQRDFGASLSRGSKQIRDHSRSLFFVFDDLKLEAHGSALIHTIRLVGYVLREASD